MYKLIRPFLFALEPEAAHYFALNALKFAPKFLFKKIKAQPITAMGLNFPHAVGLAAGMDKNGQYIDALAKLGFAFIEVGTITPRPQTGNIKPRLFRLKKSNALINRMGFNNLGVDVLVENLKKTTWNGIIGVNIGKNKDTPLQTAIDDYLHCLNRVYPYATYITINVSSPNTPNLRELQHGDYFKQLLATLKSQQLRLADSTKRYVPLVVKLSPDETDETLLRMADVIALNQLDGIIATNTTCDKSLVIDEAHGGEEGGLSGKPLLHRSTACLKILRNSVGSQMTIIAAGGITDIDAAAEKYAAGASLIQLYTGLVYQGPSLVHSLANLRSTVTS